MLSFDITDRNIRVVKGVESSGKIKISSAATISIDEGLIVNGHVKDVPNVATTINSLLKTNRMPDKEAIVSISSNLTIFKEMTVAKGRGQELQKTVKLQMQAELNLDDSYSVSYIIVGDADNSEVSEPSYKILATACPYEIVNSYREMFKLLGITLRSVMIGCNCITKVLLADTKIRSKMPLLAVQIDNNFISLNLYEQGQLSFSRFASIDAADYGYSDDYVFEAVNENIFRMLQFHRSRNTGESIENVIFYGDTHEYVRLTDELEKLDLKTSLINVPPQIHGHENLEFSLYANAIGAMFKRNRETEKINLLDTDLGTAIKQNMMRSESAGNVAMLVALIGAIVVSGGCFLGVYMRNKGIENKIEECEEYNNSERTQGKLRQFEHLTELKKTVTAYYTKVNNANDAYLSQPVVSGETYDTIEKILEESCKKYDIEKFEIVSPQYNNGKLTFTVTCDGKEDQFAQKLPSDFTDNLLNDKQFMAASYGGYTVTETVDEETNEKKEEITFTSGVELAGNKSAYNPQEDSTKSEEAEQ
jgi:type IV pilus assembly protein PilM